MICEEVSELMQRNLDQDLDASEEAYMQAHIASCPECAAMWERLSSLHNELDALPKVVPPFSLVDAILPQLEALDQAAGNSGLNPNTTEDSKPSETMDAASVYSEPTAQPARRGRLRRLPWITASGVVAAGLVLGLYIVNMDFTGSSQIANEAALMPQTRSAAPAEAPKAMSATNGNAAGTNPAQQGAGAYSQNMIGRAAPEQSGIASVPEAGAQGPGGQQEKAGSLPFANSLAPEDRIGMTETNGNGGTGNSEGKAAESGGSPEATGPSAAGGGTSGQEPHGTVFGITGDPGAGISGSGQNSTPSSDSGGQPETAPVYPSAADAGQPDESHGIAALPPEEPAKGFAKSGEPMGITSMPAEPAVAELASPNGNYHARIENGLVVIMGPSAETIFASKQTWPSGTELLLIRWDSNTQLVYRAVNHETDSEIVIDIETQTETKLQH